MQLTKTFAASMLALYLLSDRAGATHPPLDRPTPPPCSADGICRANPETWGVYSTRWRRWPTEVLELPPEAPEPINKLAPDVPPYVTPPPEEEDRRAPPPTKPATEATEEGAAAPPTTPLTPPAGGGGLESPPSSLLSPPAGPARPAAEPPSLMPRNSTPLGAPPGAPLGRPPGTAPSTPPTRMPWENGDEPTGDLDPPPSLPTSLSASSDRVRSPVTTTRLEPIQLRQPATRPPKAATSDPPPTLRVSLATARY
jgi:hypothetical protein